MEQTEETQSKLLSDFTEAASGISKATHLSLQQEQQLQLYALYKQATQGPCNIPKPSFFDFVGKAKWEAWKSLGQKSKEDSMQSYVQLVTSLYPTWRSTTSATSTTDEDKTAQPKKSNFSGSGPVFSRPLQEADETPNSEKDLSYYSALGDLKKVEEMLLKDSSIVNEKDSEGLCALHYAADRGNKDLLLLLLKHGADLNIQDVSGQTAAHYACLVENEEILELLLQHGALSNIADEDGQTIEDIASDSCKAIIHKFQKKP